MGVSITKLTQAEPDAFVNATRPVYEQWKTQVGVELVNAAAKANAAR